MAATYTLNLNGGHWFVVSQLLFLVSSSSHAVLHSFPTRRSSDLFYISSSANFTVDCCLAQAVFENEAAATVYMYAQGQVVGRAGMCKMCTEGEATNVVGGTMTLSGGDGRALENRSVSSGLYKEDA